MEQTADGLEILDEGECVRLLQSVSIGRVALSHGEITTVVPVNFAMLGLNILFFSGEGMKLNAALAAKPVTFQADFIDVENRGGWSVLAVGAAHHAAATERVEVEARGLRPWARGDRDHLVRIRPSFFSGRRIV